MEETRPAEESPRDSSPDGVASQPLARGAVVGRYVVLDRLGAGAMGVVHTAYDPELDRKVALKVIRPERSDTPEVRRAGRMRLLREAQALAKVAHPNVVAVHDVGTLDERVWIAMELVDGETLAAWSRGRTRSWREVVPVMRSAGLGLAAAHAVGLLHRDFKPDNVMVGNDGRVRVMDFGLARAQDAASTADVGADPDASADAVQSPSLPALALRMTAAGATLGTPAYMAPELFSGEVATERSDQFSYAVALWEALYGERPFAGETIATLAVNVLEGKRRAPPRDRRVPAWLRRACSRALATAPDERFASMQRLLEALAKGNARTRRRRVALVGAAIALGAGGVATSRRLDEAARTSACEALGSQIQTSWSDPRRDALRHAFDETGLVYAEGAARRVIQELDRYSSAWANARIESCLDATVRDIVDVSTAERSTWCLDDRRMQFEALADTMVDADAIAVERSVLAATGLRPLDACRDPAALAQIPAPPSDEVAAQTVRKRLWEADALAAAGHYDDALAAARRAQEQAQALMWPPLVADARLRVGLRMVNLSRYEEAVELLEGAYFEAMTAGALEVAADAAIQLATTVGTSLARPGDGRRWAAHAELVVGRLQADDALRRAEILAHLGRIARVEGRLEEAREQHEQALAIRERILGPSHPSVAESLAGLATDHAQAKGFDDAKRLYQRAVEILEQQLGPDHPRVSQVLSNLAIVYKSTDDYETSRRLQERAIDIIERTLGPDHVELGESYLNLGNVDFRMREYEAAKANFERARAILTRALGPDHPSVAAAIHSLGNVYLAMNEPADARPLYESAVAIRTRALGPDHPSVASTLTNLAMVYEAEGNLVAAEATFERSLEIQKKAFGPDHPRLANALTNLAGILVATGRFEAARSRYERVVALQRKAFGPEHPRVADALTDLAAAEQELSRHDDARAHYEQAIELITSANGDSDPQLVRPLVGLAGVLADSGATASNLEVAERALTIASAPGFDPLRHAEASFAVASALGTASANASDRARAHRLALAAREALRGDPKYARELTAVEAWLDAHGGADESRDGE